MEFFEMANDGKSDRAAAGKAKNSLISAAKATFQKILSKLTPGKSRATGVKSTTLPATKRTKKQADKRVKPTGAPASNAAAKGRTTVQKAADKKVSATSKKRNVRQVTKKPDGR